MRSALASPQGTRSLTAAPAARTGSGLWPLTRKTQRLWVSWTSFEKSAAPRCPGPILRFLRVWEVGAERRGTMPVQVCCGCLSIPCQGRPGLAHLTPHALLRVGHAALLLPRVHSQSSSRHMHTLRLTPPPCCCPAAALPTPKPTPCGSAARRCTKRACLRPPRSCT